MPTDYSRIPDELRAFTQWVCWRYEDRGGKKPTKVPYNPRTGQMASVTDPITWCGFYEAIAAVEAQVGYNGIGFVITKNDPYTFIDIDDAGGNTADYERQLRVYKEMNSYSERSPSGTGLHIIVKGHIPQGRRRNFIEIYAENRYMTMTGDVVNDVPIEFRQDMLHLLWAQMGAEAAVGAYDSTSGPQREPDCDVIDKALNASNGDKFRILHEGRWNEIYPSQSEADFAYVDILAFYTDNHDQIIRLFLASPLGQRDKAKRKDYIARMIRRAFDNRLPQVEFVELKVKADELAAMETPVRGPEALAEKPPRYTDSIFEFWQPQPITAPPGLLGDIAQFIYAAAPRPVPEIAIAGAIGLMAGVCGRAFNVSGTGLNQYTLLVAPTGTGKEAIASGIEKLMKQVVMRVPAADSFIGPGEIASGQALVKHLSRSNPCFVSILGEVGLKFQQLANPRASNSEIALLKVLLDLFNKSGFNDMVRPTIYADKDKNTLVVARPAISLLGESTPESLYAALDESMIASGLLPRFMMIEYTGKRPPRNKNHTDVQPSYQLADRLAELCSQSLTAQHNNTFVNVTCDEEAQAFLDQLDRHVDNIINSTQADALRQLWNRAHIKTLKLAALVAVGCDFYFPKITLEHAQWAYNLVCLDIMSVASRFTRGEIGRNSDESKQTALVMKCVRQYVQQSYESLGTAVRSPQMWADRVIPMSYIQQRVSSQAAFRNDRRGPTEALKRCLQSLNEGGDLVEIDKHSLQSKYGTKGRAFLLNNFERLPASMATLDET